MLCLQGAGAVGGLEVVGECHAAALRLLLAQRLEFLAALGDELVVVLRGQGRGVGMVRHGQEPVGGK